MTVGELIEELREYPKDFMVVIPDSYSGCEEAAGVMHRESYGYPAWENQVEIHG